MNIITQQTGDMLVNCYILFQPENREAVVIDPGGSKEKIFYHLEKNGLTVTHILLTHGHFDHIGAVKALKEKTGAKIYIHEEDASMLTDPTRNLSVFIQENVIETPADVLLKDGDCIKAGGMEFKVLHTPGHSEGSVCFMAEDNLFTGDTLFYMSVGRTDFIGCSEQKLLYAINHILGSLPEDYKVYPGHGVASTLDFEKQNNPFFERA